MTSEAQSSRRRRVGGGTQLVLALAGAMWIVEAIDAIDSHRLDRDGIVPRNVSHLYGILTAPFLHTGFGHLLANTVPFLVLGLIIAFSGTARVLAVTAVSVLVSGIGTWLTAPSGSVTIGASGVVFGYAGYLIARGLFDRRITQIALGLIVAVALGGVLLAGLLPHSGISWQAHLFGGIGGVIAAWILAGPRPGTRRALAR